MADTFEIDFLSVETKKSGDAITLRYKAGDVEYIHVVDAGFQATGPSVADHLRAHYGHDPFIDHVVATHPDGDHIGGLRTILADFRVGRLWMLRPWVYADVLFDRFPTYNSADRLRARLRSLYPNLAALEDLAAQKQIPISEPFQGQLIGSFTVLAPSISRYLDLIVASERTPEGTEAAADSSMGLVDLARKVLAEAVSVVKSAWGVEIFPPGGTSAENEMSVVQYAYLAAHKILLTGDAGRDALNEAADFAPAAGLILPGVDRIQIPHHGSRHNVSTEVLDRWLGGRWAQPPVKGEGAFRAYVSSAKEDPDHPRKSVKRAFIHRGGDVRETEGTSIRTNVGYGDREGWSHAPAVDYPDDQEA